jgi:hypothetical protein
MPPTAYGLRGFALRLLRLLRGDESPSSSGWYIACGPFLHPCRERGSFQVSQGPLRFPGGRVLAALRAAPPPLHP